MSELTIQVPESVLDAARRVAARQHKSVEELTSQMLAEFVKNDEAWEQRVARGKQVSRERFLEILNKAPNVPPMPGDELPD